MLRCRKCGYDGFRVDRDFPKTKKCLKCGCEMIDTKKWLESLDKFGNPRNLGR